MVEKKTPAKSSKVVNEEELKRNQKELREAAKKQSVLKMIEIRLKGISEATNRAKIAFIITIIASCAMLITIFNSYFSFTRQRAFEGSLQFKAVGVDDAFGFFTKLNNKDGDRFVQFIKDTLARRNPSSAGPISAEEKRAFDVWLEDLSKQVTTIDNETISYQSGTPNSVSKDRSEGLELKKKLLLKPLFDRINVDVLEDMNFYRFGDENTEPKDDEQFNELFRYKVHDRKIDDPERGNYGKKLCDIKKIIKTKIYDGDTLDFYKAGVNHINKAILERIFPQIEWETTFAEKNIPYSIYEQNKRAISGEWIENQNIRISLLGVNVNVDQFSLLGSTTLMVISFWMLFSERRENRAVITLLRDVKEDVKRPKERKYDKYGENEQFDDWWDIANLAFHGIVHNMVFAQTGRDDRPMSTKNIFPKERLHIFWRLTNLLTALWTRSMRFFVGLLFFLPFAAILAILLIDDWTTTEIIYPFFNNPAEALIKRNIAFPKKIAAEIYVGYFFCAATFSSCLACLIFQIQTTRALIEFDERLRYRERLFYRTEIKLFFVLLLRPIKKRLRKFKKDRKVKIIRRLRSKRKAKNRTLNLRRR